MAEARGDIQGQFGRGVPPGVQKVGTGSGHPHIPILWVPSEVQGCTRGAPTSSYQEWKFPEQITSRTTPKLFLSWPLGRHRAAAPVLH